MNGMQNLLINKSMKDVGRDITGTTSDDNNGKTKQKNKQVDRDQGSAPG